MYYLRQMTLQVVVAVAVELMEQVEEELVANELDAQSLHLLPPKASSFFVL